MSMLTKKTTSITPEMFKRLVETPPGDSVTCMVYGAAKSGKTWFMGTAGSRMLFISNGNGSETLRSPLYKEKVGANPIIIEIKENVDASGIPETFDTLERIKDAINYAMENMSESFDTICLDDSTALRRSAMFKGLEINQKTNKSKTLADVVDKYEVLSVAVQDYGMEMSLIMSFFIALIDMCKRYNKHLIVGAHERYTYRKAEKIGEQPTVLRIRPAFTGQAFPDDIAALWDCVLHSEAVGGGDNTAYRMRTSGDEVLVAGTRYGGVFKTVEINLNFKDMLDRIVNSRKVGKK